MILGYFTNKPLCLGLYVPSMWRGFKKYEDIPSEEIDDIELVGDDFMPSTYISFTSTFKYLGTIISWDLRECNDVQARIKAANKLFGSAKATFWSNSRVPFELRMLAAAVWPAPSLLPP